MALILTSILPTWWLGDNSRYPLTANPDTALDRLRRQTFRGEDAGQRADDRTGPRLYLADLVHALTKGSKERRFVDFCCGSTPEVRGVARNVCCWGTSGRKSAESRHCRPNVSCWGYNGSQSRTLESPFVAINGHSAALWRSKIERPDARGKGCGSLGGGTVVRFP
jgi:hypothetical protein